MRLIRLRSEFTFSEVWAGGAAVEKVIDQRMRGPSGVLDARGDTVDSECVLPAQLVVGCERLPPPVSDHFQQRHSKGCERKTKICGWKKTAKMQ